MPHASPAQSCVFGQGPAGTGIPDDYMVYVNNLMAGLQGQIVGAAREGNFDELICVDDV